MAKRSYRWFIEPKGATTNAVIARICPEENCCEQKECSDGIRRNLWICSAKVRDDLITSKISFGLSFNVFRMELPGGEIKNVNFIFNGKKSRKNKKKLATSEMIK